MFENWSFWSTIFFVAISIVAIAVGVFITLMIEFYPEMKKEFELQNVPPPLALKFLPPSVKKDGTVNFVLSSSEVIGMIDGKEIYAFLKDDHGIWWVYDGIQNNPKDYVQRRDDPLVRIFVGKIAYCAILNYEQ
jgi:hypothetical protein